MFTRRRHSAQLRMLVCALLASFTLGPSPSIAQDKQPQRTSKDDVPLQKFFKRFPQADANKDGVLTFTEGQAYLLKLRSQAAKTQRGTGKVDLPEGAQHLKLMVPMQDGTKIATDVLLPPGEGPWPVMVFRTPYGRLASLKRNGLGFVRQDVAWVAQDFRGLFDSEGSFDSFSHEVDDGHDALEWVARQKWCNGRIGMQGGSGPGIGAKMAMVSNHPKLVTLATVVAASNLHQHCFYHRGVLRAQMHDVWLRGRGEDIREWPKPRTKAFTAKDRARMLGGDGRKINTAMLDIAGWYDIFQQSALDDFMALKTNPHNRTIIGGTGHGPIQGLKYPANAGLPNQSNAWLLHWLKQTKTNPAAGPPLLYYLMGDTLNPKAPGNTWKQSKVWPIPHTPTSFYLTSPGTLAADKPSTDKPLTYRYDPRDPVRTIGGANLTIPKGPMDQRPLKSRKDILRFQTEPLGAPLEVTGKVILELNISSDVPDTTFMAKLVDVYPNGYEALVLDSAIMARYWNGPDKPTPLEKNKTYQLTIDLWSTALVFDKGHRIAVHVTSSNAPRYEVHPNSYEPVDSFKNAPIANNTIHTGGNNPSRLILPVIAPSVSQDYKPRSR